MKLSKYDDKLVRVTEKDGTVFEGICRHNSAEYCECELGKNEESIQIENYVFYKSFIESVEEIKEFTSSYGTLEKMAVKEGMDIIEDILFSEEDIHTIRLLVYLNKYVEENNINYKDELNAKLKEVLKYNENDEIKKLPKDLVNKLETM